MKQSQVALGKASASLLLEGGRVVDVLSGEVITTNVAVANGRVAGIGDHYTQGQQVYHLRGRYLIPGLIDGHIHVESSMVGLAELARLVVPHGTTTVVSDLHEIANVLGLKGMRSLLNASRHPPIDLYLMVASCVPATHLETSGARLAVKEIAQALRWQQALGLGEMMNFPGVICQDPEVMAKLQEAKKRGKVIDGHAPGLSGPDLNCYVGAGIQSDHECVTATEAQEKLRLGMHIFIREGSAAKNLADLLPVVTDANHCHCSLVTDDLHPQDLIAEGHLDHILRKAVGLGLDPVRALQMATINHARYFGLREVGAIAPGYWADLVVVDDLEKFQVEMVFKDGVLVASEGDLSLQLPRRKYPALADTVHIEPLDESSFRIPLAGHRARVIEIVPDQIITRKAVVEVKTQNGVVMPDPSSDLLKIAVVERHHATGNIGLGLIRGMGLRQGALASSVAHDSHNIVVIGTNDPDMRLAVETLADLQGGQVLVANGRVLGSLPLPIAGLMSDQPGRKVADELSRINGICRDLGAKPESPFMTMSFLALPVIPELKITDQGLVDVGESRIVPLEA